MYNATISESSEAVSQSCDRVDWNDISYVGYARVGKSRSCDRVDWNALNMKRTGLSYPSRSCDRVDWNKISYCFLYHLIRLGLATEWIEMNPIVYIHSHMQCLGLATEWIEITQWWPEWKKGLVSVLRPSGLKYEVCGRIDRKAKSRSCDRVDWNISGPLKDPICQSSRSCDRVDWNTMQTETPSKYLLYRSCDRVDWNIGAYEGERWHYQSRSCDRVDWNCWYICSNSLLSPRLGLATEGIEIRRFSFWVSWYTCLGLATEWIEIFLPGWKYVLAISGLGLATEWIEILLSICKLYPAMSRSCDRVDWNSTVQATLSCGSVSVLRPSR